MQITPQILFLGVGGVLVVGLILFAVISSGRKGDVSERLDRFGARGDKEAEEAEGRKKKVKSASALAGQIDKAIASQSFAGRIARDLAQANMKFTVSEFLALRVIATFAGLGVGYLIAFIRGLKTPILPMLLGAILGLFLPSFMLRQAKGKRLRSFNNQLGDTITLLANSLRSGYSLLQAMEMVSRESPPPVSEEFHRVVQEVGLGLSAQDSLANLLRRVPSEDLDLMITAINIQHEVGGNLAQILDTIGHTIRERVRIKGEIRVLVAQQRISGYVVAALPFLLGLLLSFITPTYMLPLFKVGMPPFLAPPGQEGYICLPVCAGLLMVVGFVAIQKIVNIEV